MTTTKTKTTPTFAVTVVACGIFLVLFLIGLHRRDSVSVPRPAISTCAQARAEFDYRSEALTERVDALRRDGNDAYVVTQRSQIWRDALIRANAEVDAACE